MTTANYADYYKAAVEQGNLKPGGGPTEQLPADEYRGTVVFVSYDKQPADGKRFGLKIEIAEGPQAGKTAWADVKMYKSSPKMATRFFITMEKFGLTQDFFATNPSDAEVASRMKDVPVTFRVSHRQYDGRTIQDGEVVSVNKTTASIPAPVAPIVPPVVAAPPVAAPVAPTVGAFNPLGGPIQQAS